MAILQCYNKGCGQKFEESTNNDESCQYHPGAPIFHDADKKWSCCQKRSRDFTAFLGMPGCCKGKHNGEKPPPQPKYTPPPDAPANIPLKPAPPTPTRADSDEMRDISPSVSDSLKRLLEKEQNESLVPVQENIDKETGIKIGEPCKRNGCQNVYSDASSNLEQCKFHPGGPVFHEGLKYWSCCKKKTTDFSEFLAQPGCSTDKHLWISESNASKVTQCRWDWHQTSSFVTVSVYAKCPRPAHTRIQMGRSGLIASIRYGKDLSFKLDLHLAGVIDPENSSVTLAATKIEIKMKKSEAQNWQNLNVKKKEEKSDEEEERDSDATSQDLSLDPVDLSDL